MNKNKKTKNIKQNKAINNATEKDVDINATRIAFNNGSIAKNK